MNSRGLLVILLFLGFVSGQGQYLSNPSFEGVPLMIGPPDGWAICDSLSTPNVQPGKYDVYLAPSDGVTYVGLLTRETGTWEDMYSVLDLPLSKDSCYVFKIDLAYQALLSWSWVDPIVLKVYGSNDGCNKDNLLWASDAIDNTYWETSSFLITGQADDITVLILEVYYTSYYDYWGYMLLDNIVIEQTPQVDLGNDTTLTLCDGDSLLLDPGEYNSYLWPDSSTNSTFMVDSTGVYWVEVTSVEGCTGRDSIEVIIEEYVEMESGMIDSTYVCEGQEIIITASAINGSEPYTYDWIDLPDTTQSVAVTADTSMYFYVLITDDCGQTMLDSIKINVVENPVVDLGNDTLICPDGNYFLSAGDGYFQYLWQDESTDSTLNVTEPGLYWVQVVSYQGCSGYDSINIELFPPFPVDIGNDSILCMGETLILDAGPGFTDYLWQDNSTDTTFTATTTGQYWVVVTDINGCTVSDTVDLSFLDLPDIDIGPDTSICSGEELILDAGSGYVSYVWQNNDSTQYLSVTQGGIYWVTVDNGCGTDTDTLHVELLPSPMPDLGSDTTLCIDSSLLLEPGAQYISYLWQDNSSLPFYNVSSGGNYSVMVENNYGCTGSDEIYVNYTPYLVDLGPDDQLCEGESVVLDAGEDFVSYLWQDNSITQTYALTVPGIYSVLVEDIYGCITSDEVSYSFYPLPAPAEVDDMDACIGDTVNIVAPEGDFTYYWDSQPGTNIYQVTDPGSYVLSMVNPCDSISDAVQVTMFPLPDVFLGDDEIILPGESLELDAGSGFDEYTWQDGSGTQYFMVSENNIDPENPYFYVEVTQGICKNSDTVMVELYKVWVPNVITPNGDGKNDVFEPDPESWAGINSHNMTVFNRWGEKVWESEDFEAGWDGKRNGSYVADGVYFWVLTVYYGPENLQQVLKGNLTVLGTN